MPSPSLGQILRTEVIGKKPQCLLELERQAAEKGPCAQRDLQLVEDFFHQAIAQFTNAILARIEIKPLILGNGYHDAVASVLHTYRWKRENGIAQATHPYHAVWQSFETWCRENDLYPRIDYQCDCAGKQSWHVLSVGPAPQ
jgi:hypothetical protein